MTSVSQPNQLYKLTLSESGYRFEVNAFYRSDRDLFHDITLLVYPPEGAIMSYSQSYMTNHSPYESTSIKIAIPDLGSVKGLVFSCGFCSGRY
jgi:hypothetical protein